MSGTPWNEGQKAYFPNPASVVNQYHNFVMPKREWLALGETISSKSNSVKKEPMLLQDLEMVEFAHHRQEMQAQWIA